MKDIEYSIINLREDHNQEILDKFIQLYDRTFTDPGEHEDPSNWSKWLWDDFDPPNPITNLLVMIHKENKQVMGGIVFEYYRLSSCGLLTYLVVDPTFRHQHLATILVSEAIKILKQQAGEIGKQLNAVFGETEDPYVIDASHSSMPPHDRLQFFEWLNAKRIDFPYVQPPLLGGKGYCTHLLLLSFPLSEQEVDTIDSEIVRDFLHEFYLLLSDKVPEQDSYFLKMSEELGISSRLISLETYNGIEPKS